MKTEVVFSPLEYDTEKILQDATRPERATSVIPEWFRQAPRYHMGATEIQTTENWHNLTLRHCMPFLDGMTSGYVLTTSTDINVIQTGNGPILQFADNSFQSPQLQYQEHFESYVPAMPGFDKFSYAWSTYWRIKTPPGVSCLFTQPIDQTGLPFFTLSGITDTDSWYGSDVLNCALQKDFEGIIPKGTPYVQIIPFYRNDWTFSIVDQPDLEHQELREKVASERQEKKIAYYRDNIWTRKSYA